jgi:hypothetical protein
MTLVEGQEADALALREAKLVSAGLWTKLSPRDLQRLAATKHLRGFAVHDEVFVWDAYEETHYGMLAEIGIEENEAIPFMVRSAKPLLHGAVGGDDPGGDWEGGYEFPVGDAVVLVSGENADEVRANRGFCHMVGLPAPKGEQRRRPRFAPEIMAWIAANGWDNASVDAYQKWSGGYWPWDGPDTADDGTFPFANWRQKH